MQPTLSRSAVLILLPLLLLFLTKVTAQTRPNQSLLQVIPRPRTMTSTNARFELTRDVRVVLAAPNSAQNKFAVEDFLADARETANVNLRTAGNARRSILVGELDRPRIVAALKKAGASIPPGLHGEGYVLTVTAVRSRLLDKLRPERSTDCRL